MMNKIIQMVCVCGFPIQSIRDIDELTIMNNNEIKKMNIYIYIEGNK